MRRAIEAIPIDAPSAAAADPRANRAHLPAVEGVVGRLGEYSSRLLPNVSPRRKMAAATPVPTPRDGDQGKNVSVPNKVATPVTTNTIADTYRSWSHQWIMETPCPAGSVSPVRLASPLHSASPRRRQRQRRQLAHWPLDGYRYVLRAGIHVPVWPMDMRLAMGRSEDESDDEFRNPSPDARCQGRALPLQLPSSPVSVSSLNRVR